jgi:hypothetical protein
MQAEQLRKDGMEPYAYRFDRTHYTAELQVMLNSTSALVVSGNQLRLFVLNAALHVAAAHRSTTRSFPMVRQQMTESRPQWLAGS